ncbi:transposase [Salmonella enterica subsp. enterica serovar Ball]|nr:transposase [Salmonella enterica subsp. salamae]EDV5024243.1 transposase [Salmonella enterica subsp. enterica serovar Ball]
MSIIFQINGHYLMERQQWMGAILCLHYEQHFSRGAACKQLRLNESTAYKFFRRFEESGLSWPLPDEMTPGELEQTLYPSKFNPSRASKSLSGRRRRPNFSPEFKRHLVELSMQPGVNIAQLAREHGINDNLLFNWRRKHQEEQGKSRQDAALVLMPVEIAETRSAIVDVTPLQPALAEPGNTLCCEVVLPEGTVKLSGAVTPTLLRMLPDELKGERR